uniref:Uncharacterized protein n=1 Tax=Tanacetum cinerariifolium TaxID=118510 RepID=A0A699GU34_TANCI|nr:hypothetical protein [Tanacetum cinerariifolium]
MESAAHNEDCASYLTLVLSLYKREFSYSWCLSSSNSCNWNICFSPVAIRSGLQFFKAQYAWCSISKGLRVLRDNLAYSDYGIRLMLAPTLAKALQEKVLLKLHGIRKRLGSLSLESSDFSEKSVKKYWGKNRLMKAVRSSSYVSILPSLSSSSHVFASPVSDRGNIISQYKDAKTWFEAIQAIFDVNDATKKTQRTLLKHMYENFNAPSTESLDSIFNRLHKIVSQMAVLCENISQEDLNIKFLRSLPAEWNTHVVIWRNKADLDTISIDDLYNNFKIVEKEVKRTVVLSSSSGSLNMAFLSFLSSTNEVDTASIQRCNCVCFSANQPNGSKLVHEDLEKIYEDDLEEMDLKWQLSLLSFDGSYMADDEVLTNMALMDFSNSEVSDSDEDESGEMVLKTNNVQHKPEQANQPRKDGEKTMLKNVEKGTGQITKVIVEVPKPRKRRGVVIQDPEETKIVTVQPKVQAKDKGKVAKLITEVVTTVEVDVNAASVQDIINTAVEATKVIVEVPKPKKRKGVIIQDPEETTTTVTLQPKIQAKDKGKAILIEEPGPLKRSEKLIDDVMKYQALKIKPLTEAQAKRNMIVYLKNMANYKMNYFKGISYDEIRPLFEKYYNYNHVFLNEVYEGIKVLEKEVRQEKEVEVESSKTKGESLEQEIAKKQKIEQETEELKKNLQIVLDDDDVYADATPLASKILIINYKTHTEINSPYFKIIRANGNHRERFENTEPKNDTDDYLLNTLKIMFEKANVKANVWKDQKGKYSLAKVKSWKLIESCEVHCLTLSTTQIFLLVKKMYLVTHFTLEQMVNDFRLEVHDESKISLELLRLVKRQLNEGQFSGVKVDCSFGQMELFCFIDEVFDSEYVQVRVTVQQVHNWKHVYASKREIIRVHMLTKPQDFDDNIHKQALGYQNLFYQKKAQRIKPTFYDGIVIFNKHVDMPVIDHEETLILVEVSQSKMFEKEKDPEAIKLKISNKPIDYVKLNKLFEDYRKRFVPQQELSTDEAFWYHMLNPSTKSSDALHVKVEAPIKLRKSSVDKQHLEIAKKELLWEIDQLLKQIMSQDIILIVMNPMFLNDEFVNMERKRNESCDKCLNLDAELLKSQNAHNDLLNRSKEQNVNYDYCEIETKNAELENSVVKFLSENERLCKEINHVKQVFKDQFDSIKKTRVRTKEQSDSLMYKLNLKSAENEDLKAQIQDKVFVITSLKNDLRKLKGKEIVDIAAQTPSASNIVLGMFKLDLDPLAHKLLQNRKAHIDYHKYTQEQADILRGIVEQAKAKKAFR